MMVAHDNWYLGASIAGACIYIQSEMNNVKLAVNFVQRMFRLNYMHAYILHDSDRSITGTEFQSL